jgi:uncharacterized membrane protein
MDLRRALYELAARYRLDTGTSRQLHALAGLNDEPAGLAQWLPRGVAVLGAALGGLGVIFWVAAQWASMGRMTRFALLQAVVLVACGGAAWRPSARAPLGLVALLGIGALLAFFGQTYQTGADPWQLFALWAALALPLALGARSDVIWAPWALVVMAALALWTQTHTGHRWRVEPQDLSVHLTAWGLGAAVITALTSPMKRHTGAGPWSLRTALTLWVVMVTTTALGGLFHHDIAPHYGAALAVFALAAVALGQRRRMDLYGLSAVALGLNVLLVAGLARLLFDTHRLDGIGSLTLLGLVAAGLLAATVSSILKLSRGASASHEGATA